jgi:hypothetical protein
MLLIMLLAVGFVALVALIAEAVSPGTVGKVLHG